MRITKQFKENVIDAMGKKYFFPAIEKAREKLQEEN